MATPICWDQSIRTNWSFTGRVYKCAAIGRRKRLLGPLTFDQDHNQYWLDITLATAFLSMSITELRVVHSPISVSDHFFVKTTLDLQY